MVNKIARMLTWMAGICKSHTYYIQVDNNHIHMVVIINQIKSYYVTKLVVTCNSVTWSMYICRYDCVFQ